MGLLMLAIDAFVLVSFLSIFLAIRDHRSGEDSLSHLDRDHFP